MNATFIVDENGVSEHKAQEPFWLQIMLIRRLSVIIAAIITCFMTKYCSVGTKIVSGGSRQTQVARKAMKTTEMLLVK
ncbi:hypothetical protein RB195_000093 [Necator americanus]|uniref:Uncharacterized protein n=1 Tax=Necator americanus TaxID=51031 RepID=A0ABR1D8I8_NECAM